MVDYDKKYFIKDGRGYVVRFFDCENNHDLRDLILTVESPEVQRWMENVNDLNFVNYRKWMDEKGEEDRFLFAIADPRDSVTAENVVHGFVYVYPSDLAEGVLEVSYAKRPGAPAGLIAPALKTVCELIIENFKENNPFRLHDLKFVAEIEKDNIASIKVVEKIGFKKKTEFDSKNEALWIKDINEKEEKIEEKKIEQPSFEHLNRVRQENGAYCGPAVVQILLSHFGIVTTQDAIAESGHSKEYVLKHGMSLEQIANAVRKLFPQMSLWVKRDSTLFDLEKMVREFNYPVVVNWQGVFELGNQEEGYENVIYDESDSDPMLKGDEGHYSVVIDLDRATHMIRLIDPWGHYAQKDRFIDVQEFLERWWDDRMDKNSDGSKKYVYEHRLMFVVVPKNVRVPESLGMVEI